MAGSYRNCGVAVRGIPSPGSGAGIPCVAYDDASGDDGPGSRLRDDWPITSAPLVAVKMGTRLISVCRSPAASHGIQMLYDAPSSVGV